MGTEGFCRQKNNGILNIVFICAWQKKQIFLETLKMQKAVRSWCQNSPQLAAWVCQLHILVPKQKKNKESKK